MKRVVLFVLTNLAVVVVLGIVVNLLGANRFLAGSGIDVPTLLVFAFIFGMGGSVISLFMSKWIAKTSTGAEVITQPRTSAEQWLLQTVHAQAGRAGIGMPEVAIQLGRIQCLATAPIVMMPWWLSAPACCRP